MKTSLRVVALILSSASVFTSCKKEGTEQPPVDYTSETSVHSDDQNRFSAEVDGIAYDADLALEVTPGFAGRVVTENLTICDADIVYDTTAATRTITITYNGLNCFGNRTRTGVVTLSMPQNVRWKNAGAVLTITLQNVKITRVSDNKSITLNGTQTYTNVTGGLLVNLPTLGTITHLIASNNLSVMFDNGTQRAWQVGKKRDFTYSAGVVLTTTGTHTEGATTGISEWGTNRFGTAFTTAITQPLVIRQDCNFRLVSGKAAHTTSLYNAAVTFGLNANGEPTGCPGLSNYFMKIVWTGPFGNSHTSIVAY